MTKQSTLQRKSEQRIKRLSTSPAEMAAIMASLPYDDQAILDLENCPSMQSTNEGADDHANFHNRTINQEFNH